ncbi:MAG: hypothetical protein PHF35_04055 [Candidatus Moranbacteria bacterium]|nr:hypothetical protein [Candidatus Moranbacteria bacterium]
MGAEQFYTIVSGKTPQEAFDKAIQEAHHEYGHEGYTGTIAEKDGFGFVMIPMLQVPEGEEPLTAEEYAVHLIKKCDKRVDDVGGPAGCIQVGEEEFLFFGWALC